MSLNPPPEESLPAEGATQQTSQCPPAHRQVRRVAWGVVAVLLVLLAFALIWLLSGNNAEYSRL